MLGDVSEEVNKLDELVSYYTKRLARNHKVSNAFMAVDVVSGMMVVGGAWLIYEGARTDNTTMKDVGWTVSGVGALGIAGVSVVWNIGGSAKVKLW